MRREGGEVRITACKPHCSLVQSCFLVCGVCTSARDSTFPSIHLPKFTFVKVAEPR